jgi:O-antigen ligase
MPDRPTLGSDAPFRSRRTSREQVTLALDICGSILVIATVGWLLLVAQAEGGDPRSTYGVVLVAAGAYVIGRGLTTHHPWVVPGLILLATFAFAGLRRDVLLGRPLRAPLGYSNAAGSLAMLAAAAALVVFVRARDPVIRGAGLVAAAACMAFPWLNHTRTAGLLALLIPIAILASDERAIRWVVAAGAAAAAAVFGFVVYLGWAYTPGRVPDWIHATLSERRLMLWNDAIVIALQNPITGIGPGRFPAVSPTAIMDPDTIWPHNELLHFAAESGLVGLFLFAGIFAVAFARLWWARGDQGTALAAAALSAVAIHSSVDYVLHYPAVAAAAAAIVATGSSDIQRAHPTASRSRRGRRRESQMPDLA